MSALVLVPALMACTDAGVVEIGEIEGPGAPLEIHVPSSAVAGQPITIGLVTYGNDCVTIEDTQISASGDGVEITPHDRRTTGGGVCPQILRQFVHDATVTLSAGSKTIEITGNRQDPSGSFELEHESFAVSVQ